MYYYIDPTNGYIFRSLKDIDRYLLTGKLGRHVTKTKPKDLGNSTANLDMKPVLLKQYESKKKVLRSNGMTKACAAAPSQKSGGNSSQKSSVKASRKEDFRTKNSNETDNKKKMKKDNPGTEGSTETVNKSSKDSKRRNSKSSRKREVTPFFILDPDECEDDSASEIPNLSEIIDSVQKQREGPDTVYISAPAIGALLQGRHSPAPTVNPQFSISLCKDYYNYNPNFPSMLSTWNLTKPPLESNNTVQPNHVQHPSPPDPDKSSEMVDSETKDNQEMGIPPVFGDLLTDPCIDFAIKTLTGTIPFGTELAAGDSYIQHQVGSSTVLGDCHLQPKLT